MLILEMECGMNWIHGKLLLLLVVEVMEMDMKIIVLQFHHIQVSLVNSGQANLVLYIVLMMGNYYTGHFQN